MSHKLTITFMLAATLAITTSMALSNETELHIGKFSAKDLTGWKDQVIFGTKNSTVYSFMQDNGKNVLVGKSLDGASGIIRKIELDPKKYPIVKWSWKIEHIVKKGNERTRSGHDFSARLYVVFPRGFFASTRAIEYVWGNVMHKGEMIRNPYTSNMVMIAVDTGDELAGHWTSHKRNYAEDYRTAFGEEAPKAGAIAIMTDSDNTHESAVGYYGDITVLAAAKEEGQKPKEQQPKEQPPKEHPPKEQPLKEQPPKELPPKEQPLKELPLKNHKTKEPLQKEQNNGNGHTAPSPAASQPATAR